ncbi:MAG: TSUP family transporter [Chloroflexi bacterium]|nr:TSUP family transporter [Chloroflexota bacterium]
MPPEITNILLLALILVLAHMVETTLGFGDTIIALAFGLFLFPLEELLPALVALAILQSTWLVIRWHRQVNWRLLLETILPLAALGMIAGILIRNYADETVLIIVLGVFIMLVSAVELIGLYTRKSSAGPLPRYLAAPVIVGGGIFHGLFATGGPLIVYYAGREIREPQAFLGTLAVLWLILNVVLYATMWIAGSANLQSLQLAAVVLPGFIAGVAIGSFIKVKELTFKTLTWSVLFIVGMIQLIRAVIGFIH